MLWGTELVGPASQMPAGISTVPPWAPSTTFAAAAVMAALIAATLLDELVLAP